MFDGNDKVKVINGKSRVAEGTEGVVSRITNKNSGFVYVKFPQFETDFKVRCEYLEKL